jgi:sec-independent protein translocase protein TatA
MIPRFGPVELILILVIVTMLFGVGKLPEVFGSVGKGIREFRKNSADPAETDKVTDKVTVVETTPVAPTTPVTVVPVAPVVVETTDKQTTN